MILLVSLAVVISSVLIAVWIRNKWTIDTFNSYGIYGRMAGLYLYKKFGLWHIGTTEDELKELAQTKEESRSTVIRELHLKPGHAK